MAVDATATSGSASAVDVIVVDDDVIEEDDADEYEYVEDELPRGRPFKRGANYNVNHLATFKYAPQTEDNGKDNEYIDFGMDRLLEIDRLVFWACF